MDQRLDLLTIATPDLDASRRFYLDGMGWKAALDLPGEVLFLQVNHGLLLAIFGADDLADDMGLAKGSVISGAGFTLSHNAGSTEEVDRQMAAAEAAGANVVKRPQRAAFGGYNGYFEDPTGVRWEVAYNPAYRVDDDGRVYIETID